MELTATLLFSSTSTHARVRASIAAMSARGVVRAELDRMYRAHHALVFRLVTRLGVSAAHAEDVTHDVFIAIANALPIPEPVVSERAWVAGVTRNLVLRHRRDLFRFLRRREAVALESAASGDESPAVDVDAILEMQSLLGALSEDQRVVFVLMDLEDWTAPEVAEMLGVKLPTVYSRQRAARIALEQALGRRSARERRLR